MVSFHPSLIRSRSCSSGAYLVLSLSVCPLLFRFLSSASLPVPATQPLFLPFLFLPVSASQWLPQCSLSALASLVSPVLSDLVSRVFSPGSSYSASCLFPFILPGFAPTAVPPVLPFCFRFRAFPFRSAYLSSASLSVLTTQPSVLSFPFFPFSPVGGSSGASFLFRPACFHAFLPIPVLSFLQFLSPTLYRPTVLLQRPGLPLRALPVPLCLSLQVRLLGFRFLPFGFIPVLSFVTA